MSKDMNVLLVASLFGSAILSLLVSLALVLIFMLRQKERKEQDNESFKARAMKESREFGLLSPSLSPTEVRRLQQANKHDKQLDTVFLSANAKEKKGSAATATASSAATAATASKASAATTAAAAAAAAAAAKQSASKSKSSAVKKSSKETQPTTQEKLRKHQEVTRWREEHDRTIGGNWGQLQRNPVPPAANSPLPSLNSEETGSDFVSTTSLNLEY